MSRHEGDPTAERDGFLGMKPFAGRRVLVTGAGGFYGMNLLARLAHSDAVIACVTRGRSRFDVPGATRLEWMETDLSEQGRATELFKSFLPDIVFHLTSASLCGPDIDNIR